MFRACTCFKPSNPWEERKAPDGQTYYYNRKTKEATYERPAALEISAKPDEDEGVHLDISDVPEMVKFSLMDQLGSGSAYEASSIEELRVRIALKEGVLSPCIRLFKGSETDLKGSDNLIEDTHVIANIFDPDKQPHELRWVTDEDRVKQEVADWSPDMWICAVMLHLKYGDQNIAEHAWPLKSADKGFREKMEKWVAHIVRRVKEEEVGKINAQAALGVDLSVADGVGWTLLHQAAERGWMGVFHALLDAGARVDARDEDGMTPLGAATKDGRMEDVEIIQSLLAKGADPSLSCKKRHSIHGLYDVHPIHTAIRENHFDVVKLLIEAKANLNVTDVDGDTPLHNVMAFKKGRK